MEIIQKVSYGEYTYNQNKESPKVIQIAKKMIRDVKK